MEAHTRACVAYVAARLVSGQDASEIFDQSSATSMRISGTVQADRIDVLDHQRGCQFAGSGDGKTFDLVDHGSAGGVELTMYGNRFEGFDAGSQSHFFGEVHHTAVSLFDVGDSGYFHYSLPATNDK